MVEPKHPPQRGLAEDIVTTVRSIRAEDEDWERWQLAAFRDGLTLNAWAKRALTRVAELEEALARQENECGLSDESLHRL